MRILLLLALMFVSCAGIPMNKSDAIKTCVRDVKEGEIFLYEAQDRAREDVLEEGDVYKARSLVERSRRALYVTCQSNIRQTQRYKKLKDYFEHAEEMVVSLEHARAVVFVGDDIAERDLSEDHIELEWKDSAGRTLSDEDGRKL